MIRKLFGWFSGRARDKRATLFRCQFRLAAGTRILDLGSESGDAVARVLRGSDVEPGNVYIADISAQAVIEGSVKHGYKPIVLKEDGRLPFADNEFDVVYCSSVIEHVTVSKQSVWNVHSGRDFQVQAEASQLAFAREIRRVGRGYFVQTPNRYFPLESHTWLPLFNFLPRPILIRALRVTNKFWVKKSQPDFHLLETASMRKLFPDAEIHTERFLGLTKSLIAIRKSPRLTN